jgi:hypothetical protein
MSTISAGTASGTALVQTGDTTGQLVLQTNGSTTAVTIATNQVVTLAQPLPVGSGGTGATSLSGITVGTATSATTATNLAGGSNGTIPYQSAAGTTQMLAVGTSGQVLKSNGASAPSWITPSSGALVFISSATASSSATIDFTGISSTYDVYVVEFVSIVGASSTGFKALTSSNNGSSYDTSNYAFSSIGCGSSIFTAQVDSSGGGATYISIWNNNSNSISSTTSDSGLSGFAYIMNPASSANTQILWNATWCSGANAVSFGTGTGVKTSTSPVNAIRFLMNSGNIASGTIRLYGIANS